MTRPPDVQAAYDVVELLEAEGVMDPRPDLAPRLVYMFTELLAEHLAAARRQALIEFLELPAGKVAQAVEKLFSA